MIKISFILPEENMKQLTIKIFKEHNELDRFEAHEHEEFTGSFMVTLQPQLYLDSLRESDIIVARGVTALNVKRLLPDSAVVEIPFSGHDVISTVIKIVQENGKVPIGIVNSTNMVYSASNIAELLGTELRRYIFDVNTPDEITRLVDKAIREGCKAIMGGIDTCEYAQQRGIPAYPFPMSRESIWQAISEAKHNALIRNRERAKAVQFSTILDYAYEGIIASDRNGQIVTFNSAAERILGIFRSEALGHSADTVLHGTHLDNLLRDEQECTDYLVRSKNYNLTVNKIRMHLHERYIGNVLTFQDVDALQKTERAVRGKIYYRGHVAKYSFENFIGDSLTLRNVLDMAKMYANFNSNIMITGETGTGKELLAQSIHRKGKRQNGPFVAVNCAALPKNLIESELFGYAEGAFTGAAKGGKPGMFELAHGGTIFLDEISEMPFDVQGRLLRVIQEREIMRIGDDRVISVDVRIISASNRALIDLVEQGLFRQDLYYRLNVLTLHLPPFRERGDDAILLVLHYLRVYAATFSKLVPSISKEAVDLLRHQTWQGNAREIRNVCERLMILCKDEMITAADLQRALGGHAEQTPALGQLPGALSQNQACDEIIAVLKANHGDKTATAKQLGISRATLWRKMKAFKI